VRRLTRKERSFQNAKGIRVGWLFAVLLSSSAAYGDSFSFHFTAFGGLAPTAGSFSFDSTNVSAPFSNFDMSWDGLTFDLTSAANAFQGRSDFPVDPCNPSGPSGLFSILTGATVCPVLDWEAGAGSPTFFRFDINGPQSGAPPYTTYVTATDACPTCAEAGAYGTFTVTDTTPVTGAVPEPGSLILLLTAMAATGLAVVRKGLRRDPQTPQAHTQPAH
jgi:hypothetical protein